MEKRIVIRETGRADGRSNYFCEAINIDGKIILKTKNGKGKYAEISLDDLNYIAEKLK